MHLHVLILLQLNKYKYDVAQKQSKKKLLYCYSHTMFTHHKETTSKPNRIKIRSNRKTDTHTQYSLSTIKLSLRNDVWTYLQPKCPSICYCFLFRDFFSIMLMLSCRMPYVLGYTLYLYTIRWPWYIDSHFIDKHKYYKTSWRYVAYAFCQPVNNIFVFISGGWKDANWKLIFISFFFFVIKNL